LDVFKAWGAVQAEGKKKGEERRKVGVERASLLYRGGMEVLTRPFKSGSREKKEG